MTMLDKDNGFESWADDDHDSEFLGAIALRALGNHHRLLDHNGLTSREQSTLLGLLPSLKHLHGDYRWSLTFPYVDQQQAINAKRWEESGLEMSTVESCSTEGFDLPSLVASVQSGRIRAAAYHDESHAEVLAKLASHANGTEVLLGDHPLEDLHAYIADSERKQTVLWRMTREAAANPYQGKYKAGPYKQLFTVLSEQTQQQIQTIDPRLTMNVLHDNNYWDTETHKIVRELRYDNPEGCHTIGRITNRWPHALKDIAAHTWEEDKDQTLPEGLLDMPKHIHQTLALSCANTAFRMVFEGVTDHAWGEEDVQRAIISQHKSELVYDEEYLKLFETAAFKNEFDVRTQSMQFMGMSLESIASVASVLKNKRPQAKILVVVGLQTDISMRWNTQHRVVLCDADSRGVSVLDPKSYGITRIPKQTFCERWAVAQNSGYLVIAA